MTRDAGLMLCPPCQRTATRGPSRARARRRGRRWRCIASCAGRKRSRCGCRPSEVFDRGFGRRAATHDDDNEPHELVISWVEPGCA